MAVAVFGVVFITDGGPCGYWDVTMFESRIDGFHSFVIWGLPSALD